MNPTFLPPNTALILIDIQKGFLDTDYWGGSRNNPDAEKNAGILLGIWRKKKLPVFHVKHNSTNPVSLLFKGKAGNEFNDFVLPKGNEAIIEKNVNSAFIGTDLKDQLDKMSIRSLVIAGLTTDHCISTSVRMAGNLGFETYLISDACATFDKLGVNGEKYTAETLHQTQLAGLNGEFATVVKMEAFLKAFGE